MQDKPSVFYEAPPPQASRELAELRTSADYEPPFQIIRRRVIDDYNEGRMTIDATVVIRIGDIEETEAARGVGVVHALDMALRKALLKYFPFLASVKVTETYTHGSGESTEAEVDIGQEIFRRPRHLDHDGQVGQHGRGGMDLAGGRLRMAD